MQWRENIKVRGNAVDRADELIPVLTSIMDPEIGLDIYNLGLIYEIYLNDRQQCLVTMTFTSAGCACAETVPEELVEKLTALDGIEQVYVNVIWEPVWQIDRISRLGRISLGIIS